MIRERAFPPAQLARPSVHGRGYSEGGLELLHRYAEGRGGCLEVREWFAKCSYQFLLGYAKSLGCRNEIGDIACR